jgi:predicted ester cyclase
MRDEEEPRAESMVAAMPEENKALIRRLYDEGINRRDAAAAAAFYAIDAKNHGRQVGRAGMQAVFEALFSAFPDFHYRIEESTAEADRVVCKVTMSGTHLGRPTRPEAFSGMLNGVAPTGEPVKVLQFHSFRVGGGEILEHSAVRDDLGMLLQLGLLQRPAGG